MLQQLSLELHTWLFVLDSYGSIGDIRRLRDEPNAYSHRADTCLDIEYVNAKNICFFIHSLRFTVATSSAITVG